MFRDMSSTTANGPLVSDGLTAAGLQLFQSSSAFVPSGKSIKWVIFLVIYRDYALLRVEITLSSLIQTASVTMRRQGETVMAKSQRGTMIARSEWSTKRRPRQFQIRGRHT
jgi:hypothetical protein